MATATETAPASESVVHEPGLDATIQATVKTRQSIARDAATILGVPPNKLCDLLRNVWTVSSGKDPLSDQEMFAGISLIARYQLDPITREIYVTRDNKNRLMTIVGIDGWIKILDRTDHYDGFEVEIHHDKHGNLDWVETAIYSTKRSKPSVYRAYQKEYVNLAGFMASRIPSHMLRIFSLRHAARNFVPLGATVVTEEEAAMMMRTSEPAPSSLDELTTRLMEPLKRDSDEASEGKEPEPQPTSEPVVDAPSHQAAFGECTTITEAGELEKSLIGDMAPSENMEYQRAVMAMGEAARKRIRSNRGAGSTKGVHSGS